MIFETRIQNTGEKDREEKEENNRKEKKFISGAVAVTVLIILMYFACFPLPVYQVTEGNVRDSGANISIMSDPDWISQQHEKMIGKTTEIYSARRDEIVDMLVHSEITDAAISICQEKVASGEYGETAEFAGYSWFIPEAADEEDITLTPSEADEILYLYSCLYDEDFISAVPDFYEKWLYGDSALPASVYSVDAFGNRYDFTSKGGYFLKGEALEKAKELSYKAGMDAVCSQLTGTSPLMRVFSFLIKPFMISAYAEESSGRWVDSTFVQAYMNCYDMFCAENGGSAFIDTVIYTGVSDQMPGEISFSLSGTAGPVFPGGADSYSTTIEDYIYRENDAKDIIAGFCANPFAGRLQITTTLDTDMGVYVGSGGEYTVQVPHTSDETCYDENGNPMLDENGNYLTTQVTTYTTETRTPAWEEYKDAYTYGFTVQAFPCKEMVNFVFQASVNGSGIPNALSKLLQNAYDDKGNENAADYNGADIPWCARFVASMFDQIGLHITDEAGCAYWHSLLTGEAGTVYPGYTEPCFGYEEYSMADITCWGGNGYTPQLGDIVIWNQGGEWTHIGYVVGADDWSVTIANGNNGGMVQYGEYTHDDGLGLGTGSIIHVSDFDNIDIADLQQIS